MIILFLIFIFLILRFTVTLFNFISNPKLPVSGRHHSDFVSILIPASHRADNTIQLLESIVSQDYVQYEVLVLDPSTDSSYLPVREFCSRHEGFSVIRREPLPKGWHGKNYAYHQLAESASGQYLMFLDPADVVQKGLISNAIHRMKAGRLSLLSLFADQNMKTIGERLVVPLINFLLLNLIPLRLVRLSKSTSFAAASSQFMLFDAKTYREHKWHAVVRDRVLEDAEIMRLVKGNGYQCETLLANGLLTSRMYRNFREAVKGLSQTILAGFGNSVAGILLYLFLVIIGPISVAFYLGLELLLFGITLIVLSRMMISLASGQNPWINLLLHPLQMMSLFLVAVLSIQKHYTRSIAWKERKASI
jgi:glycosyltransferase involved in cell wall biosynthesis